MQWVIGVGQGCRSGGRKERCCGGGICSCRKSRMPWLCKGGHAGQSSSAAHHVAVSVRVMVVRVTVQWVDDVSGGVGDH